MTVYIEYVILDNFIIDWILLKATLKLTGSSVNKGRLFCCAFFGSCLALIYPLLHTKMLLSLMYKISTALLIVLTLKKHTGCKDYFKTLWVFLAVSLFTGGVVFAIFLVLSIPYSSEIAISLMVLPVYLGVSFTIRLINFLSRRAKERAYLYNVELTLSDKTVKGSGLLDTGNSVYYKQSPVIFIDKRLASEFVGSMLIPFRKIHVNTVSGNSTKICFTADKLKIYYGLKEHTYNNVTVAVADFGGQEYSFILHPDYEEVSNA